MSRYLVPHQVGVIPDKVEPDVCLEQLISLVQVDYLEESKSVSIHLLRMVMKAKSVVRLKLAWERSELKRD